MTLDEALLLIRHYLSSLAWVERAGIKEVAAAGGSAPVLLGRTGRSRIVTENFRHDYLPDPTNSPVRLALAFYREGLVSGATAYAFLNFFKIINILHPSGKGQIAWINANLIHVRDAQASERVTELGATVPDIGKYLYESGRCAVAHAFSDPLIDPENVEDGRRLARDLPVAQALAEVLIERDLGVQSRESVWREHLYQLDGFRSLLGANLTARLKAKAQVGTNELPPLPAITVRVRDKPELPSFVGLQPEAIAVEDGTIWLRCTAPSRMAQLLYGVGNSRRILAIRSPGARGSKP